MNPESLLSRRLRGVLLFGLLLTVAFAVSPSGLSSAPTLVATSTVAKPGEEVVGTGIAYGNAGVYFSAYWHPASDEAEAIVGKFAAPMADNASPVWSRSWPGRAGFDTFMGVDVGADGVYYAGASFSQTSDANGPKERKEIAVKFNLDGSPGSDTAGAVWVARQRFRPFPTFDGDEFFNAARVSVEGGTTYFYGAGHAQENSCNSNYAIRKYTANGAAFWHWTQSTLACGRSDFNAVVVNGPNVYAAGFSSYAGNHPQILRFSAASGSGGPSATFTGPLDGYTSGAYTSMAVSGANIYAAGYLSNGEDQVYLLDEWNANGVLLAHKVWSSDATKSNGQQLMGITAVGSRLFVVGFTRNTDNTATPHNMGAVSIALFPNNASYHGYGDGVIFEVSPSDLSLISTTSYGTDDGNDQAFTGVTTDGTDLYVTGAQRSGGIYQAILQQYSLSAVDTTPPTTTAAPSLPENLHGWRQFDFNVTMNASDNPGGSGVDFTSVTITRPDGTVVHVTVEADDHFIFNVGEGITTAVFHSVDKAGNVEPEQTSVFKVDKTAPSLTAPTSVFAEATGPSGATVDFTTSASDGLSGIYSTILSQDSGTAFPLGNTGVTFQATDLAGNSASANFNVTVQDTTAPSLSLPSAIHERAPAGATTLVVNFNASSDDIVDGTRPAVCTPPSGSAFPIGTTTVDCHATDAHGNTRSGSFTVSVARLESISTTTEAGESQATIVPGQTQRFVATVFFSDGSCDSTGNRCGGSGDGGGSGGSGGGGLRPAWRVEPASIASIDETGLATGLAPGIARIIAELGGASCLTTNTCATLIVRDITPPVIGAVSDIVTEATSAAGSVVTFSLSAADNVDPSPAVIADPPSGSTFSLGTTLVAVTSTDASGNSSHATFNVTVRDTTQPVVTTSGDVTVEVTSPAGAVATFSASATDIVDGPMTPVCTPASGSTFPIGMTTVTCSATDAHLNTGSATLVVTVLSSEQIIAILISEVGTLDFQQASNLLQNALASLTHENAGTACNQLAAFINQVEAQRNKSLTDAEAAALINTATGARGSLACP